MGGKTQTSTSQVTIPPEVLARYNAVNARGESVANTPFQAYSSDPNAFVAPMTATQNQAINQIANASTMAQPYFQTGAAATMAGMGPANLGELDTQKYMSPYLQNVVQNTADIIGQQNQQAMSGALGSAIGAGAGWGDRSGIAAANLARQQQMGLGSTIGNLLNQGYMQAQGVAQQQQGADLAARQANLTRLMQGGQGLGQLGSGAQGAALAGGQALLGAGTQEQQTNQAGLSALYNQFLQERAYPFQVAQFLGNLAMGTGALSGSTTTTTQPAPFFSDERLKENVERVGKLDDGQPVYRYNYKGRPGETQIGLLAQDVEKRHPEAVGLAGGYKTVDYNRATDDAASMGGSVTPQRAGLGYARGGYADGGSPLDYSAMVIQQLFGGSGPNGGAYGMGNTGLGGIGYIPQANLPVGQLQVAEPVSGPAQTGLSELADTASTVANTVKTGSEMFDKYTEAQAKKAAEEKAAEEAAKFDVENRDENTSGTFARGGLAMGGGMPYDPKFNGYVPNNSPERDPKLMKPNEAPDPVDPLGTVKDIAKIAAMFMARGGAADGGDMHTVLPGDTLTGIARKYGKSLAEIIKANPSVAKNPDLIRVGQKIVIPQLAQAAGTPTAGYEPRPGLALAAGTPTEGYNPRMPAGTPTEIYNSSPSAMFRRALALQAPFGRAVDTPQGMSAEDADRIRSQFYTDYYSKQPIQRIKDRELPALPDRALMDYVNKNIDPKLLESLNWGARKASGGVAGRNSYAPGGWTLPEELVPYWKRMRMQESGDRQFDASGKLITGDGGRSIGGSQISEEAAREGLAYAGLPFDAERLRNDAEYNDIAGQGYFAKQAAAYGSPEYGAAAYNAGPGRIAQAIDQARAHGRDWREFIPASTRDVYLKNVMGEGYSPPEPGLASARPSSNDAAVASELDTRRSPEGGLLPKDWQEGIDKFNTWGKENESFIVPLISGIGGMLASPSITFGGALGSGLMAGAKSFSDILSAQSERNLQGAEAAYNRSQLVRPSSIKGLYEVYDERTGTKRLMSVGELRDAGIPVPAGAEDVPAPGLVPPTTETAAPATETGAGERPSWIKEPYFKGAPEAPKVEDTEAPGIEIPELPPSYVFKPVITDGEYIPSASVQLSPASIQEARHTKMWDYEEGDATYANLSDTVQLNKQVRNDLIELTNAIGAVPEAGFGAAGTSGEARAAAIKLGNTINRIFGNVIEISNDRAEAANDIIAKINAFLGSGRANQMGQHAASIASTLSNVMPSLSTNPMAARELLANMLIQTQKPIDQFDYYNKWQETGGSGFAGAKKSFENDTAGVYSFDKEVFKKAMTPGNINGVYMTPIEALRTGVVTPEQFNEVYPGIIRYVYGQ